MTAIAALWLPILVSAVLVFAASSIIHMAPLWHRSELPPPPDGDRMQDALRPFGLRPGEYMLPRMKSMKDCNTPEAKARFERGPNGMLTVLPNGGMNLGKFLGTWFVYTLVVSFFLAYLAGRTMAPGVDYLAVFRFVGTAAFMAYGLSCVVNSIWMGIPWSNTIRHMFDGLLYALVTAGTFGWLWPR